MYCTFVRAFVGHQSPSVSLPDIQLAKVFEPPLRAWRMLATCFFKFGHLTQALGRKRQVQAAKME
jgi:hypothetical protein